MVKRQPRTQSILPTIIFKTIGTHSPEAYNLREIDSPAPTFQCCVSIFVLFEATTVSVYSTTTWGEMWEKLHYAANYV